MKLWILQTLGKTLKKFNRGSALVGYLDEKLKFNVLKNIDLSQTHVVLVTGTNGKTTIVNKLTSIYKENGQTILSNTAGANLSRGIKNCLIMDVKNKKINKDVLLFEVDEKSLKYVIEFLTPDEVIITNFFRDQLDRYFEVGLIVEEVLDSIVKTQAKVYYNGQDAYLENYFQHLDLPKVKYSIEKTKDSYHEEKGIVEIKYCMRCKEHLKYNYYHYSHIGDFYCPNCDFKVTNIDYQFNYENDYLKLDNENIYEMKNVPYYFVNNSALITSYSLENKITIPIIKKGLINTSIPMGRNEIKTYLGKKVYLNLVKNVVGMEQTLAHLIKEEEPMNFLIVINDKSADGKDLSWIWDVDFSPIIPKIDNLYVAGSRKNEINLRFMYENFQKIRVFDTPEEAIDEVLKLSNIKIITNYTPLTAIKKHLESKNAKK